MNTTAIFAVNPRPKDSKTGKIMGKYHRGYAEPATAETVLEMISREDVSQTVTAIRNGQVELKDQLPSVCPHYSMFRRNHRAQADIVPEAFTYKTCIDIDEPLLVEQAKEKALEVNADEYSEWEHAVLYIDYSPRKKLHIWVLMPKGMTIEESQRAFCEEIGVPYDESCVTPERYIYMTGDEVYRSDNWLKPLSNKEIEERREAFLARGLDMDGRKLESGSKAQAQTITAAAQDSQKPCLEQPQPADDRTRYIVAECLKEAGLQVCHLNTIGGIHNAVKSMLSVGATQLLGQGELLGVLRELMPQYWDDPNILQLIADFYQKYTDTSQKMTQFQRRVFAESLRLDSHRETSTAEKAAAIVIDEQQHKVVYGDKASLSDIYSSPEPPMLPEVLPRLPKAVTALTPDEMKATVAQGMFPALGVYPNGAKYLFIDNQYRELRMNCLVIAETGSGKDTSMKQPLKHITKPMVDRDNINRKRLQEFNEQYNSKSANADKPKRPVDLIIQHVSPDITSARLSQCMADSQGAFLYTHLHEFEQWYGIEGVRGISCTFKNLKLADDEDNPFGQERAGAQSVNYRGPLGLNWNASTTPTKAQYMFRHVLIDGPISRLCLATTPYMGLGAPIPVYGRYDQRYDESLKKFIDCLKATTGEIYCKQAWKLTTQLKAECDQFAQQTQDEVFDNLSHRALVHAFRKACLLYSANGNKWEKAIEGFCRWSLHYDLWLKLHFFGDLIRNAGSQIHTSHRGPSNLLDLLPQTFKYQDAVNVRMQIGKDAEHAANMLSQWVHRGYIIRLSNDTFKKA